MASLTALQAYQAGLNDYQQVCSITADAVAAGTLTGEDVDQFFVAILGNLYTARIQRGELDGQKGGDLRQKVGNANG